MKAFPLAIRRLTSSLTPKSRQSVAEGSLEPNAALKAALVAANCVGRNVALGGGFRKIGVKAMSFIRRNVWFAALIAMFLPWGLQSAFAVGASVKDTKCLGPVGETASMLDMKDPEVTLTFSTLDKRSTALFLEAVGADQELRDQAVEILTVRNNVGMAGVFFFDSKGCVLLAQPTDVDTLDKFLKLVDEQINGKKA